MFSFSKSPNKAIFIFYFANSLLSQYHDHEEIETVNVKYNSKNVYLTTVPKYLSVHQ